MTGHTYDEVYQASKKYFNGNDLAAKVFVDKYALRDNDGAYHELTPDDMHHRLAKEFARIDDEKYGLVRKDRYAVYREAMDQFARIVPQGSPMCAIGNTYQKMSASNCVVIESPSDDMGSIIDSGKELAQLYKRRCGVGIDISTLRPAGASVNNAARTTSGAWSFADFYSYITRMVGQSGRRGALMITLSVHHPDVVKFATMKHDLTKVTGANVSLRISDEFLKAVEADEEYEVRWPIDSKEPKISKKLKARDVWKVIVESATKTAEPGLIMWDNMINNLPAHCYEDFFTISTNPCSEIALSAYDSCRLISLNLTGYVRKAFEKDAFFDMEAFKSDVALAQQMADNLVDLELELINKIKKSCSAEEKKLWNKLYAAGEKGRRTGLGSHGLGDALAQLTMRYDSNQAIEFVNVLYEALRDKAYETSVELAKVRGSFPVFDYEKEKDCAFIKSLPKSTRQNMKKHGRRNISILTQAPTGSVSMLSKVGDFNAFNVSSGVEPVFRNSYLRRKKINPGDENAVVDFVDLVGDQWQHFTVYHSNVKNYLNKFDVGEKDLPKYFVTSDQIDWKKRVEIQGAEQKYIDHSISSTINLPKGTTWDVVGKLYIEAWKKGLKGVTVYVDGSRDGVLIANDKKTIDKSGRPTSIVSSEAPKRPTELMCDIMHATVNGVRWTVLVGLLENDPYEIFMGKADKFSIAPKYSQGKLVKLKRGQYNLMDVTNNVLVTDVIKTSDNKDGAWTTRMLSTSLRHGVPIEYLIDQLSKDGSIVDINNVVARLLKKYERKRRAKQEESCPQCGSRNLVYEEGCKKCSGCGWSGCS